jgi:branched-chain amino acid transport system substrate-binding protein
MTIRTAFVAPLLALVAALPLAGAAQSNAPYRIGATIPLTGPLVLSVAESYVGAQIAIDDINRHGGVKGHPLQIVQEDSQGSPQAGVAAMRKLVQVDGVKVVYTLYTNVVTAQIPLADQLRVPFLTMIEVPGVVSKGQYAFDHASNGGLTVPVLREYWRAKHVKRMFAFLGNNAFGQGYSTLLKAAAQAIGAEYAEAFLDLNETDFRGVVTRAKEFNPDVVLATAQGGAAETTVLRQVRELGMTVPMFTPTNNFDQKTWRDAMGPYAEGMIFAGLHVDPTVGRDFVRAYREKMGYYPGYQAGESYDCMRILAYAIGKGGYDSDGVRNALAGLKNFPSVLGGTLSMGDDHYTQIGAVGLFYVKNGKLVKLPMPKGSR